MSRWLQGLKDLYRKAASSLASKRWRSIKTYYPVFHFSKQAFGKTVRSVEVHTGIRGGTFLTDVHDIKLTDLGDRFVGKLILRVRLSSKSPRDEGVAVRYKVFFEDGTRWESEETLLPPQEAHRVTTTEELQYATATIGRRFAMSGNESRSVCLESIEYVCA